MRCRKEAAGEAEPVADAEPTPGNRRPDRRAQAAEPTGEAEAPRLPREPAH